MIVSTLQIVVSERNREEALEILLRYQEPTCYQSGCISCQSFQELGKKNSYILIEKWISQAYLDKHICSSDYKLLLALMDFANEPPEIKFDTVWNSAGMELLEKLRG